MAFKRGQISTEYLTIISFVIFVLISIMGIALFYISSIQSGARTNQVENCVNKIISIAESVFFSGAPSRATITCYLPESVKNISIEENSIFISTESQSGISKRGFSSSVPISGDMDAFYGARKIKIQAGESSVYISLEE